MATAMTPKMERKVARESTQGEGVPLRAAPLGRAGSLSLRSLHGGIGSGWWLIRSLER
jgi:hypothetical protein